MKLRIPISSSSPFDGKISKEEFDDLIAKLETAIEKHGTVRILEHVRCFGSMPISKFWEDINFDFRNMKNFSHAAVVADQSGSRC